MEMRQVDAVAFEEAFGCEISLMCMCKWPPDVSSYMTCRGISWQQQHSHDLLIMTCCCAHAKGSSVSEHSSGKQVYHQADKAAR